MRVTLVSHYASSVFGLPAHSAPPGPHSGSRRALAGRGGWLVEASPRKSPYKPLGGRDTCTGTLTPVTF
jgi:hypothetical protein